MKIITSVFNENEYFDTVYLLETPFEAVLWDVVTKFQSLFEQDE